MGGRTPHFRTRPVKVDRYCHCLRPYGRHGGHAAERARKRQSSRSKAQIQSRRGCCKMYESGPLCSDLRNLSSFRKMMLLCRTDTLSSCSPYELSFCLANLTVLRSNITYMHSAKKLPPLSSMSKAAMFVARGHSRQYLLRKASASKKCGCIHNLSATYYPVYCSRLFLCHHDCPRILALLVDRTRWNVIGNEQSKTCLRRSPLYHRVISMGASKDFANTKLLTSTWTPQRSRVLCQSIGDLDKPHRLLNM